MPEVRRAVPVDDVPCMRADISAPGVVSALRLTIRCWNERRFQIPSFLGGVMAAKARNNLIAYGILIGACLAVALVRAARPDLFLSGPPSFQLFLSFRGTVVIGLLGLVGLFFLNRSTLRGLWDDDLSASRKLVVPFAVGIAIGLVNLVVRRFVPIDALLASFARSQGVETIGPPLIGAILGYFSGGILINIIYFLILIPPVVYLVSDRLLKGQKQDVVFWATAFPLALWEPLTNPPLRVAIEAFGTAGALVVVAFGAAFTMLQAWFMRRFGFVALVAVRLGLYTVTHVVHPRV